MRILFTNNTLDKPAGTELSVYDYARLLMARGHEVAAYSRQQGEVAQRLQGDGGIVVESPVDVPWQPEIIHGHHQWETGLAALAFPEVPVVSFCRGTAPWQEAPCLAPNVMRWMAVDEVCRRYLMEKFGVTEDRVGVVLNGVDLGNFPPRAPLPEQPQRVLVFSNYAREDNFLAQIREACEAEGVECRAVGSGVGETVSDPAAVLAEIDLVFAKGKAALEAVVSGCGLVVCDADGLGPLVTEGNFAELRNLSFAYGAMTDGITVENVRNRLRDWDGAACLMASRLAREVASLEGVVDQLEALYGEVEGEWRQVPRPAEAEMSAWAARFFGDQTTPYKLGRELQLMWRTLHGSEAEAPNSAKAETVEMHRIMHAFREQEKRVAILEGKVRSRGEKIANLKKKLAIAGQRKKRWWFSR
jgi:hypothetical protein